MYIFTGYFNKKELLEGANLSLNIGSFKVNIKDNHFFCISNQVYTANFDDEILKPVFSAIRCLEISQSAGTFERLEAELFTWFEIKIDYKEIKDKLVIGNFPTYSDFPVKVTIDNSKFLKDFTSGLKFANQVYNEPNFRIAVEDFSRGINTDWDETIYHCQHSIEAIRDYFGSEKNGWNKMRTELRISENILKPVTDFSNTYVRHGSKRCKLPANIEKDKHIYLGQAVTVCISVIHYFSKYLNNNGIAYSKVITNVK